MNVAVTTDDPRAVAKAREGNPLQDHLRAGRQANKAQTRTRGTPSSHPQDGDQPLAQWCQYPQCGQRAAEILRTRTIRKDYCDFHMAEVRGDIETRQPRKLNLVDWY